MKPIPIRARILAATLLFNLTIGPVTAGEDPPDSPRVTSDNAHQELIAALEQMVAIAEKRHVWLKLSAESGRVDASAVGDAAVAMWQAKVRLAEAREEADVAIEGRRKILALREEQLELAKAVFGSGRSMPEDVDAARLRVIEARVALCRALDAPRN